MQRRGILDVVNLILLERDDLDGAGTTRLTGARAAHITTVLNAAPGQRVRIGLIDGPMGQGTVTSIDGQVVSMSCELESTVPPLPRVDLLLALPRPKVLRRLWSQLSALGVGQIILTNAARVERHYFDTHVLDPTSYVPLLVEGLQQARDTRLPRVSVHRRFKVLVEDELDTLFAEQTRVVAHPGQGTAIRDVVGADPEARVLLAVGPEGGWVPFELDLLARHAFRTVGLGPRPLRTDTATIALLTLVHDALRID